MSDGDTTVAAQVRPPAATGDNETQLEAVVERAVEDAVERAVVRIQHSGPMPHPSVLEGYEQLLPGATERLLAVVESGEKHRRDLELQVITEDAAAVRRGQRFGFALGAIALLGGVGLAALGRDISALATIIGALGSLTTVFVVGQRGRSEPK